MKLLFDTNIVLDAFLFRQPWVQEAQKLWQANDDGLLTGYLTATTLTDIFYIAKRQHDIAKANTAVDTCLQAFEICPVNRQSLLLARTYPGNDFEDNLQIACAMLAGLDGIITRDPKGFQSTIIPIWTPEQTLSQLPHS